ncbi:MAG: hypothetical protein VX675_07830 [Planctomycetota bacterium]|nr:hypothetical protein [Planctomycetota bacterium]
MKSVDHRSPNQVILLLGAAILFSPLLQGQDSGPVSLSLADLSADLQIATGGSSVDDSILLNLQGGHHDPRKRGFTFQGLELGIQGAIDPYLSLDAAIHYTIDAATNDSHFEMVEAFLTSSQLPLGLHEKGIHLEAGQMLTEFGVHNPTHLHERNWMDQPVINSRIFGSDGMRGMGMRVGIDKPTSWLSRLHLGIQDASGETMTSFNSSAEGETIGGISAIENEVKGLEDFVYLIRTERNIAGPTGETNWVLGASGLCGPNATGADGRTIVLGADISMKWTPRENNDGWPYLIWQTEIMRRRFMLGEGAPGDGQGGALQIGENGISESDNLMDWGGYSQVLWGYRENWAVGLRYEYASGSSSPVDSSSDPRRDDRQRFSPVLIWTPTEFSRFRLQYNYDLAEHLDESPVHSIWVGMEVYFGEHTAGAH